MNQQFLDQNRRIFTMSKKPNLNHREMDNLIELIKKKYQDDES